MHLYYNTTTAKHNYNETQHQHFDLNFVPDNIEITNCQKSLLYYAVSIILLINELIVSFTQNLYSYCSC